MTGLKKAPLTMDELLREAIDRDASDIHIKTDNPPIMRLDGALERLEYEPLTDADVEALRGSAGMSRIANKSAVSCSSSSLYASSEAVPQRYADPPLTKATAALRRDDCRVTA